MPLAAAIKSMAFGELGGAITSGAGSLSLVTGEGTRFPALASGEYIYLMVIDQNEAIFDRFEIMLASAFSADTFSGLVRGLQGTTAKNFPITSGNNPANVKVMVAHNIRQLRELIHGQGAIIQATAPTLTPDSPEEIVLTPAADISLALPGGTVASGNPVWAGRKFHVSNDAAPTNPGGPYVLVSASGGGSLPPVPPGSVHEYRAKQDGPTLPSHWRCTRKYRSEKGVAYVSGSGTAGSPATAQTVKSAVVKANTLTTLGQTLRIRISFGSSSGSNIQALTTLNGVGLYTSAIATAANYSAPSNGFFEAELAYLDSTHANLRSLLWNASLASTMHNFNISGFNWAADQTLAFAQNAVSSTALTVYTILCEPVD